MNEDKTHEFGDRLDALSGELRALSRRIDELPDAEPAAAVIRAEHGLFVAWAPHLHRPEHPDHEYIDRVPVVGWLVRTDGSGSAVVALGGETFSVESLPKDSWLFLDAGMADRDDRYLFHLISDVHEIHSANRRAAAA